MLRYLLFYSFFPAVLLAGVPEIRNVIVKQRFPWNKIEISYNVIGNVAAGLPEWQKPFLSLSALDRMTGSNYVSQASAISGDTGTEEGAHRIVWDLNAQGVQIKSDDVVFTVAYSCPKYCIIDLSAGTNATSYPITSLSDVPAGGWTDEYKTTKLVLRLIESGSFKMNGSYDVTLTEPYYCGVFEVTQKQYELVMGNKPSCFIGDKLPVEQVSWNAIRGNSDTYNWPTVKMVDPNSFVGRLQARTGLNFDLPTEAQWEYACRAGTTTAYSYGDGANGDYMWYDNNSEHRTHEVGTKLPNAWGLYDMHGNVWEWCLDWFGEQPSYTTDFKSPENGTKRIFRGGGCGNSASWVRSIVRSCLEPYGTYNDLGEGDHLGVRLFITLLGGATESTTIFSDSNVPIKINSQINPMVDSIEIPYNSSWVGGDTNAIVVVRDNGTEIKRTTGVGEFVWSPTTVGKHTLTYTTYIDGVAQDEVYETTVYADWKYVVEDGKATIVDAMQKSGHVKIPSEIDGYPVVGIESDVYAGCHGLFITVPTGFTNVVSAVKSFEQNEWVRDDSESGEVYKSNDIDHNGSTYMIATVKGPCVFSFDWKVSSESGYDWLRWYLDGSQKAEISGETSWQTVTYSLPGGEHTIKWQYSKDESADNGSDCGWVRMNENMTGLDFGDAIAVCIDYPFATGGDASWSNDEGLLLRSGSITNNLSSWLQMTVPGPGKLTYKWKASSEYYEDESKGIYEIYDYGYLSVDNEAMGGLNDEYALEGVAIGGYTDWQDVEFDVTGEGEHTLRWTYVKDQVDYEKMTGEDCIWLDQIKFRPYVTLSFDLGGGVGETPRAIYELHESKIILPADAGFTRDNHVFDGWSNGDQKYAAGEAYEMPRTNVTLRAQWIEKRALSFDLGGGSGTAPSVIKDIPGSVITLPDTAGFDRAKYTFTGWNDGERTHAAGASYTIAGKDVVFTAQWRANTISTPVISSRDIANGGVLNTASATISISADSGASVYYTLDGSTPNAASVKYTAPFVADGLGSVTIKAIALRDNYFDSEVATFSFIRRPYSAAECLGVDGFVVVTEGDNAWFRIQGDSAHDGESALQSGAIGEGESSVVLMTVYGKGTISFWWKSSSHDGNRNRKYDYVSFEVDEDGELAWLGGEKDWVNVMYDVPDEGEHTLKWIYKKNSDGTIAGNDCVWLDEVVWMGGDKFDITYENLKGATHQNPSSYYEGMTIKFSAPSTVDGYAFAGWTPSEIVASDTGDRVVTANWEWTPQEAVVDALITGWKPVTVKADWVKTELEKKFGAGKKESFITRFGDNLTSAMTKKTGKRDGAGNELLVWHDYVAGTDPTDINSIFKAKIDIQDGKPVISWEPNLNSAGEERVYTVYGKEMLSDIWHSPIAALDHFFKVDVAMPREGTVTFNVVGGSSVGPVSVHVGQAIGVVPTPTRVGYTFLGWFTAQEGGVAVTPETIVTADMTIHARWAIKSYTVVFDANGGSGGVSKSYNHGAPLDEMPVPTRVGYTFLGWFTAQEGGEAVTQETIVTAEMTIYARWAIKSYTVVFDANGGSGGVSKSYDHGATLGELPVPTREGDEFVGWFTAANGGSQVTAQTVVTGPQTLYARWKTRDKVQLWDGGPYWATTNIGAEKPEDYGYYFWWGDTVGYKRKNNKWIASDGSNLNFSFTYSNTPTYYKSFSTLQSEGWITSDGVLAPEHDAARAHWGGDWRMPTKSEFDDLCSKCDWTRESVNGVGGFVVRGRGVYSANSIFLPRAGYGDGTSLNISFSYGLYWSSVPDSGGYDAYELYFYSRSHGTDGNRRYRGQSVRPIQGFTK